MELPETKKKKPTTKSLNNCEPHPQLFCFDDTKSFHRGRLILQLFFIQILTHYKESLLQGKFTWNMTEISDLVR